MSLSSSSAFVLIVFAARSQKQFFPHSQTAANRKQQRLSFFSDSSGCEVSYYISVLRLVSLAGFAKNFRCDRMSACVQHPHVEARNRSG